MVVTGAGLFLRTLDRILEVDPGFHAESVLTMHVSLPLTSYPTPDKALGFYEGGSREIAALPGVRSASFGGGLPLTGWDIGQGFDVVGEPEPKPPNARPYITRSLAQTIFERSEFHWKRGERSIHTIPPARGRWLLSIRNSRADSCAAIGCRPSCPYTR